MVANETQDKSQANENSPSDWNSKIVAKSNSEQVYRTGIPILGGDLNDNELDMTTAKISAGKEAKIIERNQQNSQFWVIAFIVGSRGTSRRGHTFSFSLRAITRRVTVDRSALVLKVI